MKIRRISEVPKGTRHGLISYFLLQHGDTESNSLAVTWVEVEPNHRQIPHNHLAEQVYIVVQGKGRMQVGDEFSDLCVGELAFIPSNAIHGIETIGPEKLVYVTASVPAFNIEALYEKGPILEESNA
jgi:mannose-6-phosphate isomerase-like protein (cupin superfamily)